MAEDGGSGVLVIEKLVEEEVHRRSERVKRKVADVFGEDKQGKSDGEGDVREGGLRQRRPQSGVTTKQQSQKGWRLTSKWMPGMNISTARPWKNLRRPFKLRIGTRSIVFE